MHRSVNHRTVPIHTNRHTGKMSHKLPVLTTACVKLYGNKGSTLLVRVLFNTESEEDVITGKFANKAKLQKKNLSTEIEAIKGKQIIDHGALIVKR